MIKGQKCTVLTVATVEEAERICTIWNRFKLTEKEFLKASIHPFSYRKRPTFTLSRHPLFKSVFDPEMAAIHKAKEASEQVKFEPDKTP